LQLTLLEKTILPPPLYKDEVSMSVEGSALSIHFLKQSVNFTTTATDGITNGDYHSVCMAWNSEGGQVDLYYDGGGEEYPFLN